MRVYDQWNKQDISILQQLPIIQARLKQVHAISWHKPNRGWFKLNVDGSSLNNPGESSAGGVLRNHEGLTQFAFAAYTGIGSNNRFELMALLLGLRHCKLYGINNIFLELDSLLIVNWLTEGRCNVWYLEDSWEEIKCLLTRMNVRINMFFEKEIMQQIALQDWVVVGVLKSLYKEIFHICLTEFCDWIGVVCLI